MKKKVGGERHLTESKIKRESPFVSPFRILIPSFGCKKSLNNCLVCF